MSAKWGRKQLTEIGRAGAGESGGVHTSVQDPGVCTLTLSLSDSVGCTKLWPLPSGPAWRSTRRCWLRVPVPVCLLVLETCVPVSPHHRVSVSLCLWVSGGASWGLISSSSESRWAPVVLTHPVCLSLSQPALGSALPPLRARMAAGFGRLPWPCFARPHEASRRQAC